MPYPIRRHSRVVVLLGLSVFVLIPLQAIHASPCTTGEPFAYTAPGIDECPVPVQTWMDRVNGCGHLSGQELENSSDEASDEEWIELQCDFIGCDYQDLVERYDGNPGVAGALADYAGYVYAERGLPECTEDMKSLPQQSAE